MTSQLQRALAEKPRDGGRKRVTGPKLVGVGIQLTLLGGFVPELRTFLLVGTFVSLSGLVVE